jgi:hypothetical protein
MHVTNALVCVERRRDARVHAGLDGQRPANRSLDQLDVGARLANYVANHLRG